MRLNTKSYHPTQNSKNLFIHVSGSVVLPEVIGVTTTRLASGSRLALVKLGHLLRARGLVGILVLAHLDEAREAERDTARLNLLASV